MTRDHIPPFRVAVRWDGMVAAVTVTGQVDSTTAPVLASRLLEVAAAHPERLVVDLGGLAFTDVASARALDSACKALEKQCPVILRAPRPASTARAPAPPGLPAVRGTAGNDQAEGDGGRDRPGRACPRRRVLLPGSRPMRSTCSPGLNTLIPVMAALPPHSRASPAHRTASPRPTGAGDPVTTASVRQRLRH
jgi:anti-anti-sigma regulatory factor